MKISANSPSKKKFTYRFDFEIGYLVKSPCRGCDQRVHFPACIEGCRILDGIHALLSESVSCNRRSAPGE